MNTVFSFTRPEVLLGHITFDLWLPETPQAESHPNGTFVLQGRRYKIITPTFATRYPESGPMELLSPVDLTILLLESEFEALEFLRSKFGFSHTPVGLSSSSLINSLSVVIQDRRSQYKSTIKGLRKFSKEQPAVRMAKFEKLGINYRNAIGKIGIASATTILQMSPDLGKLPKAEAYFFTPYYSLPGVVAKWRVWILEDPAYSLDINLSPYDVAFSVTSRTVDFNSLRLTTDERVYFNTYSARGSVSACVTLAPDIFSATQKYATAEVDVGVVPFQTIIDLTKYFRNLTPVYGDTQPGNVGLWEWLWRKFNRAWPEASPRPLDTGVITACLNLPKIRGWMLENLRRIGMVDRVRDLEARFPLTRRWMVNGRIVEEQRGNYYVYGKRPTAAPEMLSNFTVEVKEALVFDNGDVYLTGHASIEEGPKLPFFMHEDIFSKPKELEIFTKYLSLQAGKAATIMDSKLGRVLGGLIQLQTASVPAKSGISRLGMSDESGLFCTPFGAISPGSPTVSTPPVLHPTLPHLQLFTPTSLRDEECPPPSDLTLRRMIAQVVGAFHHAISGNQMAAVEWHDSPRTRTAATKLFKAVGQKVYFDTHRASLLKHLQNYPVLTRIPRAPGVGYPFLLNESGDLITDTASVRDMDTAAAFLSHCMYRLFYKVGGRTIPDTTMSAQAAGQFLIRTYVSPEFDSTAFRDYMDPLLQKITALDIFSRSSLDFASQEVVLDVEGFLDEAEEVSRRLSSARVPYVYEANTLRVPVQVFQQSSLRNYDCLIRLNPLPPSETPATPTQSSDGG